MIQEIKQEEFATVTAEGFSLVDVYGINCGPCVALAKNLAEVDFDFPFVNIYKLNSNENVEFCKENAIMGVPTILFMNNGQVVKRETGALSSREIMDIASEYLY